MLDRCERGAHGEQVDRRRDLLVAVGRDMQAMVRQHLAGARAAVLPHVRPGCAHGRIRPRIFRGFVGQHHARYEAEDLVARSADDAEGLRLALEPVARDARRLIALVAAHGIDDRRPILRAGRLRVHRSK
jgi:hypothetical protein